MGEFEEDFDEIDFEEWERREDEHLLSPDGIAEQNGYLLRRYRDFRCAADAVTAAWRDRPEVRSLARRRSLRFRLCVSQTAKSTSLHSCHRAIRARR